MKSQARNIYICMYTNRCVHTYTNYEFAGLQSGPGIEVDLGNGKKECREIIVEEHSLKMERD